MFLKLVEIKKSFKNSKDNSLYFSSSFIIIITFEHNERVNE